MRRRCRLLASCTVISLCLHCLLRTALRYAAVLHSCSRCSCSCHDMVVLAVILHIVHCCCAENVVGHHANDILLRIVPLLLTDDLHCGALSWCRRLQRRPRPATWATLRRHCRLLPLIIIRGLSCGLGGAGVCCAAILAAHRQPLQACRVVSHCPDLMPRSALQKVGRIYRLVDVC